MGGVVAGAGAGLAIGEALFPPGGGLVGALVGAGFGIAGGFAGGAAVESAQTWALNKVPKIRDILGQSEEQKRIDQEEHPVASFLGGIAPFALTMSPLVAKHMLADGATTWQRLAANPMTSRLFSGGLMGGMQLGQEAVSEHEINWNRVAVATGFGMVFNKPTAYGEAISEFGARATRRASIAPYMPRNAGPPEMYMPRRPCAKRRTRFTPDQVGPKQHSWGRRGAIRPPKTTNPRSQHRASLIGDPRADLETTARRKSRAL
jgi:hypothetical protein